MMESEEKNKVVKDNLAKFVEDSNRETSSNASAVYMENSRSFSSLTLKVSFTGVILALLIYKEALKTIPQAASDYFVLIITGMFGMSIIFAVYDLFVCVRANFELSDMMHEFDLLTRKLHAAEKDGNGAVVINTQLEIHNLNAKVNGLDNPYQTYDSFKMQTIQAWLTVLGSVGLYVWLFHLVRCKC